jgi:hypothetical protein
MFRVDWRACCALTIAPVLALAACSSTGSSNGASASSGPSTAAISSASAAGSASSPQSIGPTAPSDSAADTPQNAALTTYKQMWAAMVTAALTSDPASPELARFADGDALAKLRYSLSADHDNGFVTRGPLHISPQATLSSTTTASVADCLDSTQWLKYKPDGSLKDNIPGGRHRTSAEITLREGAWKVMQLNVDGAGTC